MTAQHTWSPGHQETEARSPESQHQTKESYDKYDTASISSLPSYNQVSGVNWGHFKMCDLCSRLISHDCNLECILSWPVTNCWMSNYPVIITGHGRVDEEQRPEQLSQEEDHPGTE